MKRLVGILSEIWRYPVKSMLGEQLSELAIGVGGGIGDRVWALRELDSGRIASAKKYPRLLVLFDRLRGGGAGLEGPVQPAEGAAHHVAALPGRADAVALPGVDHQL